MKTSFYFSMIICILVFVFSSCSVTKTTSCPTFSNKTEKVRKPIFAKKHSSEKKKKQYAKKVKASEKKESISVNNNALLKSTSDDVYAYTETKKPNKKSTKKSERKETLTVKDDILSKIISNDINTISNSNIALNLVEEKPSFIQKKVQKILIKKIEKKVNKIIDQEEKDKDYLLDRNNKFNLSFLKNIFKESKKTKDATASQDEDSVEDIEQHPLSGTSVLAGIGALFSPVLAPYIGVAFLLFTIGLGIFAIIAGGISLDKINKNPRKFKGKGASTWGIVLGSISILLLALLALLVYLSFRNTTF